ncbi:MAG: NAD-dependent epimerase/dehydratase family protein [Clostridia bacterium]|nr:NAD-dependent epimerase/dehydratase family protein [Clostridia bacterium]
MEILVTGGSGFIGKAFIKSYRKVFDIVAPSHEEMDLTDARSVDAFFKGHKFDAVLHLAGMGETGKSAVLEADNVIMFKNIQYVAIRNGVKKLITVGEGVDFDRSQQIVDYAETKFGEHVPTDGYGLGKYMITRLAAKDKISTVLRIFNVFGMGGGQSRPINKIVAAGSKGKAKIVIDRDRTVSGISIDDAVHVIGEFLRKNYPRGDYNLVAADKMSYVAIAKLVKRLVRKDGGDIEIVVKNPEPDLEYSAVNTKLVETTGIKIGTMQNGIRKLYQELK